MLVFLIFNDNTEQKQAQHLFPAVSLKHLPNKQPEFPDKGMNVRWYSCGIPQYDKKKEWM